MKIPAVFLLLLAGCGGSVDEPPRPVASGDTRHRGGLTHGEISLVQALPPIGPVGMQALSFIMIMRNLEEQVAAVMDEPQAADSSDAAHDHGDGDVHGGDGHGGGDHDHGVEDGHDDPEDDEGIELDDLNELVPIVNTNDPTGQHAIVVNPKGTQGRRYLVTEIYLRRTDEGDKGFKARVAKNSKVLEKIVRYELEDRTVEDLQKRFVQEEIKMTLLAKFNAELKTADHQTPVKRIYFSKWVMQ
ncbi:MAG: hypothetical protein CMJ70_13085 [Planctomycetaceae bacterium]|nr:hypothetical protein [Planctomycetaceae bacterium]